MPNSDIITEKVYCHDAPSDNTANLIAAMNAAKNNQSDNPFIYLVWMMYAQRMWGNDYQRHYDDPQYGYNALSNQIAAFQTRMADNHNTDLIYGQGQTIGTDLRAGFDKLSGGHALLQQTLCDVKAAIAKVEAMTGYSAERVINAFNLGQTNIVQAVKDCCCQTQQNILKMGYETQLGQKDIINQMGRDTASIGFQMQQGFDRTNTGLERGFATLGYVAEQNTCRIEKAIEAASQRQIDAMNAHWTQDLRDKLAQMSQDAQTANIVNQLRNNDCCGR